MTKIFIVEDELIVSLDLQQRVRDLGYEIAGTADNGDSAFQMVMETKPDLILMDINIKGKIDGIETSRKILQKYSVPIVYLTAYSDKITLERAKNTSPYGYLVKPIEERDLHISIEISLTKFQMEQKLRESEKKLSITLQSIGDGVIATDKENLISQMNRTAERLCGWTFEEAKGLPLSQVFKIKCVLTQECIDSPVEAVFRTGKVVELSNHTVLISRDGSERNISDSAAPIYDELGEIQGVVLVFSDVTEAYKNRELLKQSEKLYRDVIENASDIIYTTDKEGRFTHANSAGLNFTGYSLDDILTLNFTNLVAPEYKDYAKRHYFRQYLEKKATTYTEIPVVKKNGEVSWFGQNVNLVLNDGNVTGFHVISRDVTDRKNAEEALRKNEEMLRLIIDIIPDQIFVKDIEGRYILNNLAHLHSLKANKQTEVLGKTDRDLCSKERALIYQTQDKNVIETNLPLINHYQNDIRKNGKEVWKLVSKLPLRTSEGKIIGIVGICRDITEQKISDNLLRESKRRFQTLANVSPVGIFRTDASGYTTYVNPRWCEISGLTPEEAEGNGWITAVHEEDRVKLQSEWSNAALAKRPSRADYRFIKPDKSIAWVMGQAVPETNEDNRIVGYVGTITDITERKLIEEALRKSEEIFNQFMNYSPIYIFFKDHNGKALRLSKNFEQLIGMPIEQTIGKTMYELFPHDFAKKLIDEDQRVLHEGLPIELEEEFNGKYYSTIKFPIYQDDKPSFLAGYSIDITERKKLDMKLIEAKERAEAASELKDAFIANISHEIRTPLNGVLGATSIIKDTFSNYITPREEQIFTAIDKSSKRIIRTVDMILNFSRLQIGDFKINPRIIDLPEFLNILYQEFYAPAKQKGLELVFENKIGEIQIESDYYCLHQVVSNLLDNAVKYTKTGTIKIILDSELDDKIKLHISDTGIGISEDYLDQLFNPYSQEEVGYSRTYDGVGLGLSLVKNFLKLMGSEISVQSKKGIGSTFTITFMNSTYPPNTEIK